MQYRREKYKLVKKKTCTAIVGARLQIIVLDAAPDGRSLLADIVGCHL